jgi:hypothetical protein
MTKQEEEQQGGGRTGDDESIARAVTGGDASRIDEAMGCFGQVLLPLLAPAREAYPDVEIEGRRFLAGLLRCYVAVLDAEATASGPRPGFAEVVARLATEDVYLAEACVAGNTKAWARLEDLIEQGARMARKSFTQGAMRVRLFELRETLLGTFYLEKKILTYRGTGPLRAWIRQVIFNLLRRAVNQRRAGRETEAISQLGEENRQDFADRPSPAAPTPVDLLVRREWDDLLKAAVPDALRAFTPEELLMLKLLPSREATQIELCQRLNVSPFQLNRWYREVRLRFIQRVKDELRRRAPGAEIEFDRLLRFFVDFVEVGRFGESCKIGDPMDPSPDPIDRGRRSPEDS